ncbi:putative uncharacterized protein [Waddlia chondrophila 2032/99]|uniref:ACT domain-containing protein n=1 Tax=Waddlia chondrophila 2032/99 TaxID=765953 RepID=F8LD03_9BACT|nr:putative uncharacterized protein [Waddlia chondrophila 2032/99]
MKVTDQAGGIQWLAQILGDAGININALMGQSYNGYAMLSFLTDEPAKTKEALKKHKIPFEHNDVVVVKLHNKPGQTALFTKALRNENLHIQKFYLTVNGEEVIDTDDYLKTRKVADDFGIYQSI